jgi:hypothetical protein
MERHFLLVVEILLKNQTKKASASRGNLNLAGAPGGIRTHGLQIRSLPLYPTELRTHLKFVNNYNTIFDGTQSKNLTKFFLCIPCYFVLLYKCFVKPINL